VHRQPDLCLGLALEKREFFIDNLLVRSWGSRTPKPELNSDHFPLSPNPPGCGDEQQVHWQPDLCEELRLRRECSLLTTYWSESTLSSR